MLEVVFSESAAGSLSIAMRKGTHRTGACSYTILETCENGEPPDRAERKKRQREWEQQQQRNWKEAVPIGGNRTDIMTFPLVLSVGDIDENGIGGKREAALQLLMGIDPNGEKRVVQNMLSTARKSLTELRSRAGQGEPVRIWTSDIPDEASGYYWVMDQLQAIGLAQLDVTCVKLPEFQMASGNKTVSYLGWGEVAPHQWGKLALLGKTLPASYMEGLANRWEQLKMENAPLRAVLNGQLVSVPETIYDSFILQELAEQEEEFLEARVVGTVLGKYRLGIGDGWIALRIEQLVQEGKLKIVTQPAPGNPVYHRILRKGNINLM